MEQKRLRTDPSSLLDERPGQVPLASLPDKPLVSVLIASYNNARLLPEALMSLQAQTYRSFEAIVVDDGSSDATGEVVRRFAEYDPRIKSLWKPNGGMASAWNLAWSLSTGQILCLLDSDDVFMATKLALVIDKARSGYGLVIHPMRIVDGKRRLLNRLPAFSSLEEGWLADSLVRRGGRWRSQPTSGLSFRRELGDRLFPIPENTFKMNADAFIYTVLPLLTPVGVIPEVLSEYRMHEHNATAGKRPTVGSVQQFMLFDSALIDEVNGRLESLGRGSLSLRPERNIGFVQRAFFRALLDSRTRRTELLGLFGGLARATLADDLNTSSRKLVDLMALLLAIILPTKQRSWWLWNVYGQGAMKRVLARTFALLRGRKRSALDKGAAS